MPLKWESTTRYYGEYSHRRRGDRKKLVEALQAQIQTAKSIWQQDFNEGFGRVSLPYALQRKYPKADRSWKWQNVFPSYNRSADPDSGDVKRHHLYDSYMQDAIAGAAQRCQIHKRISINSTALRRLFGKFALLPEFL